MLLHIMLQAAVLIVPWFLTFGTVCLQRLQDAVSDSAAAASDKASSVTGAPKRTYKSIVDSLTSVSQNTPSAVLLCICTTCLFLVEIFADW